MHKPLVPIALDARIHLLRHDSATKRPDELPTPHGSPSLRETAVEGAPAAEIQEAFDDLALFIGFIGGEIEEEKERRGERTGRREMLLDEEEEYE